MCGRFILRTPSEELKKFFRLMRMEAKLEARYNIAPTQPVAAVHAQEDERVLSLMHWGLIPSWSKDTSFSSRMINARAETVALKPSFRTAFKRRRCLIPADGFYEWKKQGAVKQPYFIHRADNQPFAFAGLWERWHEIDSCTIITTSANEIMQPLHERMPVILSPDKYDIWLSEETSADDLQKLLVPYETELTYHAVSTQVNSPRYDAANCIDAV